MDSDNESAVGDVFVAKQKLDLENKLGTIFGIIELFALPDNFIDGFFGIISDLKTEYYLPPLETDYGLEKRFEECLQRANRRLHELLGESWEKIELKNINTLIGLIYRNHIYLSQIGANNALLFHLKKKHEQIIIDIFSQAGEKTQRINPEKMFSNIISGAITLKDNLIFCNDAVLEYFSQNELMAIVSENTSLAAIQQIEKILRTQTKNNNFYAIIIQPNYAEETGMMTKNRDYFTPPEKLATPPDKSINRLMSTQIDTEKYLTPSLLPNWKKAFILAGFGLKKISQFIFKYLQILSKNLIIFLYYLVRKTPAVFKTATKASSQLIGEPKSFAKNFSHGAWQTVRQLAKKTVYFENYKKMLPLARPEGGLSQKISDWLNQQIAKFVALNRLQQTLLVIAFIFIFFFSQSIVWQGRNAAKTQKNEIQTLIKQIEEQFTAAEAKNIFNDEAGAKNSLSQAEMLLAQAPNTRKYRGLKDKWTNKINGLKQTLQKISYLNNPVVVADLNRQNPSASAQGLTKNDAVLFVFDNQNQNLYKIDLKQKQTTANQFNNTLSNIKKIDIIDEKNIILLNGEKEFYEYNLESNSIEKKLVAKNNINDFKMYGGKLYTLQTEKNQIYKHFSTEAGFNSGSAWLKDNSDIKDAKALAIDGGIYLIYNNGNINYFAKGRAEATDFLPLDTPIKSPRQIVTDAESKYLYILDQENQRVVVLEKTGALKIQYISKEFNEMKSIVVAEKEKKIYLLAGNKVYEIEMKF